MPTMDFETNKLKLLFKEYKPRLFIGGSRWIELVINFSALVCILVLISFLGIEKALGYKSFLFLPDRFNWIIIVYSWVFYYVYKIAETHTVVEKININYESERILINYWFFFIKRLEKEISFHDFSFRTNDDSLFFGNSTSIRVFERNKYRIKLNPRNGWKKEQMDEIIKDFLIITDGKTRTVKWHL